MSRPRARLRPRSPAVISLVLLALEGAAATAAEVPKAGPRFAGLERYGLLVILTAALVVPLVGREIGYEVNPLAAVLLPMIQLVHGTVLRLTGWA